MTWLREARTWFDIQQPIGLAGDGYETVVRVPGSIRAAGGNELLRFGATSSAGQYVVTLRHRTDLKADWRFLGPNGRTLQIASFGDPRLYALAQVAQKLSESKQPLVPERLLMAGGADGKASQNLVGMLLSLMVAEKSGLALDDKGETNKAA